MRMRKREKKDKKKRNNNLQYAAMALGLITFIILFLLLSHSIIANKKLIRFLGVVALLIVFERNQLEVFIDGGWGVDALLGKQTRPHSDLDIALKHTDVPKLRELLAQLVAKQAVGLDHQHDEHHHISRYVFDAVGQVKA